MLKIKKILLKNFMSIGANEQALDFDNQSLTLILGENLDTAVDGTPGRNGVGKSSILNALSFGLFGQALTNITKDNLVNNINKRGMYVVVEFEKNGHLYRVERGRKPNFFKFKIDNAFVEDKDAVEASADNEAQGESKLTQIEVEKVLGFSHNIFKNIIALNTKTVPFLSLNAKQQREFIEELLGILQLSQKAEVLKELVKETKNQIKEEEFKIETIQKSNETIQKSIKDLERRSSIWNSSKETKIQDLQSAIDELSKVDIEEEIENHKLLQLYTTKKNEMLANSSELDRWTKSKNNADARVNNLQQELLKAQDAKCPTCQQGLHKDSHTEILSKIEKEYEKELEHYIEIEEKYNTLVEKNKEHGELGVKPKTFYTIIDKAYDHRNSIDMLVSELKTLIEGTDPYVEQIDTLRNKSIQELNYEGINLLVKLRDHQEFLLKLLTSKDSFIRKKILDQNLSYLNQRLSYYLEILGLPHKVTFLNDMTTSISYLGESLDYDSLSRGESTRLILSLSWAFRDIFEMLTHAINLIFVDELLDTGMDFLGIESSYHVLRDKARNSGKNVFLISHREELISKVSNILKVTKENGFTALEESEDFGA